MATGDAANQLSRLKQLLPPWFPDASPVLDGLLSAAATVASFAYGLIALATRQTRIKTATGSWLDLIALDFFGPSAVRGVNQSDASFRNDILINLFRERGTRHAVISILNDLTGEAASVFEPQRIQDTGAYARPSRGYGVAGAYGSTLMPYQALVIAERPLGTGIQGIAGYGIPAGAYSTPSRASWASISQAGDSITDAQIFTAIDGVKPFGTILWTRVINGGAPPPPPSFSLIVGNKPVTLGSSRKPIRLLGWQL